MSAPQLYKTDYPNVRLGSLWNHHQSIEAKCRCGRVAPVHTGLLIRKYGDECFLTEHKLKIIAQAIWCKECKAYGPELRIVVQGPSPSS